ncbi:AimR family lysis-lysogeny pheromone receptor [Bacillus inaquosorum]|uniref:AimR family lysis-lysogeny pheromone receptor n=1 Tax=Bacillus inaquosorum TaxID=483913 RepID=UPI0022815C60|nr:AimR family lysis-lysogeny pheromone receptor [Bacillus inaquosorum]MCY7818994.1 AimR family lysis-lysogeny pheromone receptor [Bacillus inaquosorum]MCY7997143.1 AimR family lysis-lysogeny pheromone receptor [Bacillus spizizenii]MCY8396704.1 AimR family lysis-lysogeny pheromone receptor [Bacillus spizizenii]
MNTVATRDIRVHLRELIKSSGEKQSTVAANIGISEGYLSKFFNGKEINFWMVRNIVLYLDSKNETELMKRYCLDGVKKKNYPAALEYCYAKRLFSIVEVLIEKQIEKDGKLNSWSKIYKFILENRLSLGSLEYSQRLSELKADCHDTKTLLLILEMYANFQSRKYELTLDKIKTIKKLISKISDPFLKLAFSARLEEVSVNIYLKQDNAVYKAREAAHSLYEKNLSVNLNLTALYILALSYMNESYFVSHEYYKKCIKLLSEFPDRNKELIQNKEEIAILQRYWGKEISKEYQVTAFAKALATQDSLSSFYEHDFYKRYALLFDGIKEESAEKLLLSLYFFSQQKDQFRSNLPKIYLIKLGFNFNI